MKARLKIYRSKKDLVGSVNATNISILYTQCNGLKNKIHYFVDQQLLQNEQSKHKTVQHVQQLLWFTTAQHNATS